MVEEGDTQQVAEVSRSASFIAYGDRHQATLAMCDGKSGDLRLEKRIAHAMLECFELWKERHHKYGRGNIAEFGAQGCLVRASDKMARLRKVYFSGATDTPDESVEDSWKDGVNYFVMGLVCHRGGWPSPNEQEGL